MKIRGLVLSICLMLVTSTETEAEYETESPPTPTATKAGVDCSRRFQKDSFDSFILQLALPKSYCMGSDLFVKKDCIDFEAGLDKDEPDLEYASVRPNFYSLMVDLKEGESPYYCGDYISCCKEQEGQESNDNTCSQFKSSEEFQKLKESIAESSDWKKYSPVLILDNKKIYHNYLKYGSCTSMSPKEYFDVSMDILKKLYQKYDQFNSLASKSDSEVHFDELYESAGGEGNVAIQCDRFTLTTLSYCFSKGSDGKPGEQTDCKHLLNRPNQNTCYAQRYINIPRFENSGEKIQYIIVHETNIPNSPSYENYAPSHPPSTNPFLKDEL